MEYGKFIVSGEDKKTLSHIKNTLTACGHIFIGYSKEPHNILRHVRNLTPDVIIVDVGCDFKDMKQTLQVMDEDLLCACILLFDNRSDELFELISRSKAITYINKPIFDEALMQIMDISLKSYKRILDYEQKVRKLNETLESRKVVEKAKWILVERDGITEAEAYEIIKKKSRDNRMPMRNIAEALILTKG